MKLFNWDPIDYSNNSSTQYEWAQSLIKRIPFLGHESVLDIGCGDGKITSEFAQRKTNGQVMGIDASDKMIQSAKKRYPTSKIQNLCFKKMNAEQIKINNKFDIVFSNSTLHWIPNHLPVLKTINTHLNDKGKVFLCFGGKGNFDDSLKPHFDTVILESIWAPYFKEFKYPWTFYSEIEYQALLNQSGLKTSSIELVKKDMIHEDRHGLEGWIRTVCHMYLEKLPQHLQSEFITKVVSSYIDKNPTDTFGRTHVQMARLEIIASKS